MTAKLATAPATITIYPTTDALHYGEAASDNARDDFMAWIVGHGFTTKYDLDSSDECAGYFVYDQAGEQVAAALIDYR